MFKLGRKRPVARGPRLSLGNYLLASLPAPPVESLYGPKALPGLSQMYANDTLLDCTSAGAFHIANVFEANAGTPVVFTDDQVIAFYSATTGYIPGDPATDQGGDEQTVLNYWRQKGLLPDGSHKIAGWTAVNGADKTEVMTALWLFENLYFGVELPDAWVDGMSTMKDNFTWDVAGDPDPENGHCFVSTGYSPVGLRICTWGMVGTLTWAAAAKYATTADSGELYTILSQDAIMKANAKSPSGFDLTQLTADLQAIG